MRDEADKWFSLYIRKKYSDGAESKCFTCSHTGPWKSFDCGHFISRGKYLTRFEEMNARPQCGGCNGPGKGKPKTFEARLRLELGNRKVNAMIKKSGGTANFKWSDLWDIKEKFREMYNALS